jgi:hypothetical protein
MITNKIRNFWNERPTAREFWSNVCYGIATALAAAFGVAVFYSICVMILLLEPVY